MAAAKKEIARQGRLHWQHEPPGWGGLSLEGGEAHPRRPQADGRGVRLDREGRFFFILEAACGGAWARWVRALHGTDPRRGCSPGAGRLRHWLPARSSKSPERDFH